MIKKERTKALKLKGYMNEQEIIRAIHDELVKQINPVSHHRIYATIKSFYTVGLSAELRKQNKVYLIGIGHFKQTQKGRVLCFHRHYKRLKAVKLKNRVNSKRQQLKKKLQRQNNLSIIKNC